MLYDVSKDEFVYVAHSEATANKLRDSGDLVVSTYPQVRARALETAQRVELRIYKLPAGVLGASRPCARRRQTRTDGNNTRRGQVPLWRQVRFLLIAIGVVFYSPHFFRLSAVCRAVVELSNVHTIYESYNAENFGHFLTDELYPAFSALSSFDRVEPDVQLLRRPTKTKWRYSCDWQVANWGEGQGKKCDLNYEMLTPLMSTNPVDKLRECGCVD